MKSSSLAKGELKISSRSEGSNMKATQKPGKGRLISFLLSLLLLGLIFSVTFKAIVQM